MWPRNSPDFNPIEILWSTVKTRLCKIDYTIKTKLIQGLKSENIKNI